MVVLLLVMIVTSLGVTYVNDPHPPHAAQSTEQRTASKKFQEGVRKKGVLDGERF
jgi:hypothetical protein